MRHLIFLLFMLCGCQLHPQESHRINRYFSVSDGLPQSYVSGIVQDNRGYVWIATRDGLAKYDGRKFKVFRNFRNNPKSLAINIISSITLIGDELWVAYERGDLDRIDTKTDLIYHFDFGKVARNPTYNVKSDNGILRDENGNLWMLSFDSDGIYIQDAKTKKLTFFSSETFLPGFADHKITGMARHGNQIVLVTGRAIVFLGKDRLPQRTIPLTFQAHSLFNPVINWIDNKPHFRDNGDIIVAHLEQLFVWSAKTQSFTVFALPKQQLYMPQPGLFDGKGRFIFAHNDKIYTLDPSNTLRELDLGIPNAPGLIIRSLLLDPSGVLWIGTNGYGMLQSDLRIKTPPGIKYEESFLYDVVQKMGVPKATLDKSFLLNNPNPYSFRWEKAADGKVWITAAPGTREHFFAVGYVVHGNLILPEWKMQDKTSRKKSVIVAFCDAGNAKMYALDDAMRLLLFDSASQSVAVVGEITNPEKFLKKRLEVTRMLRDSNGQFRIFTNQGMIEYALGRDASWRLKLPDLHATSVAVSLSDPNVLWIGTYADGLMHYDIKSGKKSYLATAEGLPNNTIYSLLEDRKNRLWCASNKGIFAYEPKTGKVMGYTSKDGLADEEFNHFFDFRFPDGKFAFGGTNGYTIFDPMDLVADDFKPKVALTGFWINNKPADFGEKSSILQKPIGDTDVLELSYKQNFLSFEFAALQYNNPEKNQYRYKIEGLDEDWVYAGNRNTASYTSIPPGDYVLVVNASNTDGIWSPELKKLQIVINPPFWKTWWFVAICVLVIVSGITFFNRQRLRRARAKDRLRMQFERETMELEARALRSQMNPHFIFNCLNSIKALIHRDSKNDAIIYLVTFSKLIRNQLNNGLREITLYEEIETCKLYVQLESLRFGDKIDYEFRISGELDLKSIKVPPLIVQPFIENAILHGILPGTRKGKLIISVFRNGDWVVCEIDDNGIGRKQANQNNVQRDPSHISQGVGLAKTRLEKYNHLHYSSSDLKVVDKIAENGEPLGTTVILSFRL